MDAEIVKSESRDMKKSKIEEALAVLTGVAISEKKELIFSLSQIVQKAVRGNFVVALADEWKQYKEKGKIKEDYSESVQFIDNFQEILDVLEREMPDAIRLELLKKIFFVSAFEDVSKRGDVLPQQFMKLCRKLSSGEILIIHAAYQAVKGDPDIIKKKSHWGARDWFEFIAEKSKLKYSGLVESCDNGLVEKGLLTQRVHVDKSGISPGTHFRLTDLGWNLCEFVAKYEESTREGKK